MKFASLEHFGLSAWRLACVGMAGASASWALVDYATGGALGQAKPEVLLVVSVTVFYAVVTIPRRVLERQRTAEAREAVLLAASAKACLTVSGSRPRTLLAINSREPSISRSLAGAARMVMLGVRVDDALALSSECLSSNTASETLRSLARLGPEGFEAGDEESRGLEASGELVRETRLPMFMTVCFFAPILMVLYAVFSRSYGAVPMSELTALEFVVVDLAFYLSSTERIRS